MYDYYDPDYEIPVIPKFELVRKTHPLFDPKKVWDFLHQTKVWQNKDLEEIRIKDIDEQYAFNILRWIDRNSVEVYFTLYIASLLGKGDDPEYEGLMNFPLFTKLRNHYLTLAAG